MQRTELPKPTIFTGRGKPSLTKWTFHMATYLAHIGVPLGDYVLLVLAARAGRCGRRRAAPALRPGAARRSWCAARRSAVRQRWSSASRSCRPAQRRAAGVTRRCAGAVPQWRPSACQAATVHCEVPAGPALGRFVHKAAGLPWHKREAVTPVSGPK